MAEKSKILVVEDDPKVRKTLSDILKAKGYSPMTAGSGREALDRLKESIPVVALIDLKLEDMSGLEVMKGIKERSQSTECIIITGYASKTSAIEAVNLGAYAYVEKPYDMERLLAMIRRALEKREVEEALQRSEEKYRKVVENANEAITIAQDGIIKFTNSKMTELSDYTLEEYASKPFTEFIHPDDRKMMVDNYRRRLKGENTDKYAFRVINKDGSVNWLEINPTLFEWEGAPATLNFLTDVTKSKQAEEEKSKLEAQLRQAQKIESIGTLASGIAHDFNNILAAVLGYTELALNDVESGSRLHGNLSEVLTAGKRAKDLVRQILAISRPGEEGVKPFQISPLVKEALKMLHSTIPTSIEIRTDICSQPLVVHGDPTQIHQVIVNLATNAMHAMTEREGILEIGVEPVSFDESTARKYPNFSPGNYARLTVSDTGTGIPEEDLDKIFEPYFTTKEKGTGTGLGLSVVHGIVKAHKGHITACSEPGKGTTFHVYLPLAAQKASADLLGQVFDLLPMGTESILLVDDEPPIVDMQQQSLEQLGYKVTAKTGSLEALEAFRASSDKFDLIITDMTMPNLTGDKLAQEIKAIRSDIPMILCTGFSEKIDSHEENLNIDGFLMKPVDKAKMAEMVRKVLDAGRSEA